MIKVFTTVFFVLAQTYLLYAQNASILKDSVCIPNKCFELQELKMNIKNVEIYKNIQKSYNIFNGFLFEIPEKRLQSKKDTLKILISDNSLLESQYGFEKYKIYFNQKRILNVSVSITSYGSTWEDEKYYFFDLKNNTDIGDKLFINKKKLLQLCGKKLKAEEEASFPVNNLSQYKINTDNKGKVIGISFVFEDEKNRTNSGYQKYTISIKWNEIQNFISPNYKKLLMEY